MTIPRYPFEPDETTGNKMFRIHRNDCVVNYRKADFLIPHRKDYYFIAFVKAGSTRHWIDMAPYVVRNNTLYFTDPQQVNLKEEAGVMSGVTISFTAAFLATDETGFIRQLPVIQNPHNGHELLLSSADIAFVEELLDKMIAEYGGENEWQQQMLLGYMKTLLIYMSRLYTAQFAESNHDQSRMLLKRYLAQIETSYATLHDVAAYAVLMNISPGHLSDKVKEQSGKPAIAHIHARLMLEAKRLLFHSDLAVKEIAFRLGFEDASYFNRFFKRISNQTPAEYRTVIREKYH